MHYKTSIKNFEGRLNPRALKISKMLKPKELTVKPLKEVIVKIDYINAISKEISTTAQTQNLGQLLQVSKSFKVDKN